MKIKIMIFALMIISLLLVVGCMRPADVVCDYNGVCEDWETDNCPDCVDVLGRGVQITTNESTNAEQGSS